MTPKPATQLAKGRSRRQDDGDDARVADTALEQRPTLFICHGDGGGPRFHPCRRVQEALRAKRIDYDKVIAGHGSPWPWRRKGSREVLRIETGDTKLSALKLPDGTVLKHSRAILGWVMRQP
jgi:hypothetical protein